MSNWLDLSNVSNILRQTYVNGFLDASGPMIGRADVSFNQKLFVSGDVSLNSRLFVGQDTSFNNNVFVKNYVFSATPLSSDNSNKLATTAYVQDKLSVLSNSASFVGDVTMFNRLYVYGDISFGSNLFILQKSILDGDVSANARLYVGSDVSLNAKLFVARDSSLNMRLYVGGDVSLGSRLFVAGDVSLNTRLYVGADVSLGSRLFVSGDVSLNGQVSVPTQAAADNSTKVATTQYVTTALGAFSGAYATFRGDVSINNRLFVGSDVSFGGKLFTSNDITTKTRLFTLGDVSFGGNSYVAANLLIGSAQLYQTVGVTYFTPATTYTPNTASSALAGWSNSGINWTTTQSSISDGRAFWYAFNGPTGNLWKVNGVYAYTGGYSGSASTVITGVGTILGEWGTLTSSSAITMNSFNFTNEFQSRFCGSFYILGANSTSPASWTPILYGVFTSLPFTNAPATTTSTYYIPIGTTVNGQQSSLRFTTYGNGGTSFTNFRLVCPTIIGNTLGVTPIDGNNNTNLTMQGWNITFGNTNTNFYNSGTLNVINPTSITGALTTSSDITSQNRLFVGSDVSLGGNLFVNNRTIQVGDISANSRFYLGSDLSMGGNLYIAQRSIHGGDVSMNARLYLGSDASFGGRLYVAGDVSLNGQVSVPTPLSSDNSTKVATTAYVKTALVALTGASATFSGDVSINNRLYIGGDASMSNRLFAAGDVSLNSRLFVGSDISINGNITSSFFNSSQTALTSLIDASFGQTWTRTSSNGNVSPAISSTGQYQIVTGYGKTPQYSSNYGQTWSNATIISGDTSFTLSAMSATGQYAIASQGNYNHGISYSTNYGQTWTLSNFPTNSATYLLRKIAMSGTGQYCVVGNYVGGTQCGIWVSNNYGNDWLLRQANNINNLGAAISYSGQYAIIGCNPGIYYTSNYGVTWTLVSQSIISTNVWALTAMSSSGQYCISSSASNLGMYYSSDYGQTWTVSNLSTGSNGDCVMDSTGQYCVTNIGGIRLSTNYGRNWTIIINNSNNVIGYSGLAMNANGKYILGSNDLANSEQGLFMSISPILTTYSGATTISAPLTAVDISANSRLFLGSDASFGSNLFVKLRTIQGGDLSANSRLFLGADLSMGGNLYVNQRSIQGGDVSMNARLYVGSDASFGGRLYVAGDVSLNGQVSVPTQSSSDNSTKVATTAFVKTALTALTGASATFSGDVSINFRLYVGSDASLQGRLFVNNDASFNRRLYVAGDVSFGSGLYVAGDASFNRRLYVGSDVSLGGNLSLTGNVAFSYAKQVAIPLSTVQANSINQSAMTTSALLNNGGAFSCSNNGQYTCNGFGYSTNYGTTYTSIGINTTTYSLAIYTFVSGTGQYMTTTVSNSYSGSATTAIYVSNNYGTSWNQITYPVAPYQAFMACSDDGTISYLRILSTSMVSYLYKSSNFGTSWTNITGSNNVGGSQYQTYMFSLTPDGKYITMNLTYGGNEASNALMTSSDYGVTWTTVAITGSYGLNGGSKNGDIPIISDNGQYVYAKISGTSYISSNYGVSFTTISDSIPASLLYRSCATSNFGFIFVLGPANLYYSTNYATSWTTVSIGSYTASNNWPQSIGVSINKISRGGNTYYFAGQTATTGTGYISVQKFNLFNLVYNNANLIMNTTNTNQLDISGNVSVTQTFLALSDVSMGGRLYVAGDASMNSRLYLGSDLSMGGNFYVAQRTVIGGDISANARLNLSSDASLNGNVYIGKDLTVNGNLTVRQYNVQQTITTLNYQLMVAEDLSVNGRLFLSNDASINQRLYVGQDASLGSRVFVAGDVSMNSRLSVGSSLSTGGRLFVGNDVSINGNLYLPYLNSYPLLGAASITASSFGQTWTSYASRNTGNYTGPAVSSTGQYQTVSSSANVLYSSNYGQTWANATVNTGPAAFGCTAISADGKYLIGVAGSGSGKIFYSSDFGQTWNGSNLTLDYYGNSLAMSATGQYCVIGKYTHQPIAVYYSSNYGQTWATTATAPSSNGGIKTAVISGDGTRLLVGNSGYGGSSAASGIWYSTNAGTTWTQANLTNVTIVDIKMSYTGQYCIASKDNGIYYSSNYGVTWTLSTSSPINSALALDGTGQYGLATAGFEGGSAGVYYTTNYGQTWTLSNRTTGNFHVALSSNGLYGIIASNNLNTGIYQQTNASSSATVGGIINVSGGLMANDISANSRLFVASNSILGGTLTVSQSTVLGGDVSANQRLYVGSDVSMGGNLFVNLRTIQGGDASMNNRLFIAGDVSMGSRLFVVSDISTNQRLFVGQDTSLNGNLFVNLRTIQNGDISANSGLFLSRDASFGGRLFVAGDVSLNGNVSINGLVTAPTPLSTDNSTKVATTAYVKTALTSLTGASATFNGDVSINFRLYVAADVSLQGRLFVNNDASLNQRLYVGGDVSFGNRLYIAGDISMAGNIYSTNIQATTTPVAQIWTTITPINATYATNTFSSGFRYGLGISSTGQYMITGTASSLGIWYSSNYGASWTQSNQTTGYAHFPSMSSTGQYAICSSYWGGSFGIKYSSNYGQTWTASNAQVGGGWDDTGMSSTGQYCIAANENNGVWYSSNYGQTWTQSNLTTGVISCEISSTGQYAFCEGYYSSNYGQTWTFSPSFASSSGYISGKPSMSSSGKFLTAASTRGFLYSNDFGVTWSQSNITASVYAVLSSINSSSSSGQYVVSIGNPMYYSSNYGVTWSLATGINAGIVKLSSTGQFLVIISGNDVKTTTFPTTNVQIPGQTTVAGLLNTISDSSVNGQLFVGLDSTLNGNLFAKLRTILSGDISANSRLFVAGDVSMGSRLFVNSDISVNQKLFVGADVSFGSRLFVVSDISTNQRLFVGADASFGRNFYVAGRTINVGDISANNRLFVGGDASFNGNVYIDKDLTVNGNFYVKAYTAKQVITELSYQLIVAQDISVNGRLFLSNDASINQRLFVGADASFGSRLFVAGDVSMGGSLGLAGGNFYVNNSKSVIVNPATFGSATTTQSSGSYTAGNAGPAFAVSNTGQYLLFADPQGWGRGAILSTNYGATVGQITGQIFSTIVVYSVVMSSDGSKMALCTGPNIYYSINYGSTWTAGSTTSSITFLSANNDFSRLYGYGSGGVFLSTNNGVSFTLQSSTINYGGTYGTSSPSPSLNVCKFQMSSATGQYGIAYHNASAYYTSNYGVTWTQATGVPTLLNNGGFVGMSSTGQYAFVDNTNGGNGSSTSLFYSTNYGASFSQSTIAGGTDAGSHYSTSISSSGRYGICGKYVTTNYGANWSLSTVINSLYTSTSGFTMGAITSGNELYNFLTMYGPTTVYIQQNATTNLFTQSLLITNDISTNSRLFIANDVSMASNLYVALTTILSGDVSANSRLYVGSDSSFGGNLFVNSSTVQRGDVSMNSRLYVGSDVSFGGKLFVNSSTIQLGDISANNRLFVAADVSFGSRLFVVSDTSINQRLFVGQDTSLNGNLFISKLTVQGGDLSANARLYLGSDASFGGRLFVRGDVSLNGNVFATTQTTGDNTTRVATTAFVTSAVGALTGSSAGFTGDVSINFRLYVGADASLNGRLFVNNDVSLNRRLYVGADVSLGGNLSVANVFKPTVISEPFLTSSDTASSYTFNYGQGSIFYITAPPSSNFTVNFSNVPTDISSTYLATLILSSTVNKTFCTSIQVNGNTAIAPIFANGQPLASTLGSMNTQSIIIQRISAGDVSMNMNVFTSITPYLTGTNNNLLVAYGDSSFNGRLFLSSDASFQGNFYTSGLSIFGGDVSTNQRLFVGGDVSMNGRLFTVGDTSHNARLYVGADASFGANLYVNTRTLLNGDISANSRLYLGSDASLNGRLFVIGDVSLNGNVFVTTQSQSDNSTKVATTAYVKSAVSAISGSTATFTGDASINNRLFVGTDASINGNLFIALDSSLNSKLFVGGDASLNGNVFASAVFKTTNTLAVLSFDFSNNYGTTWTQRATSLSWTSISSSQTGQYQGACVNVGFIFVSADYGATWTQYAASRAWTSISVSQTGQYMSASVQSGYIWTSSNFGQTWTQQNSASIRNWSSVAISSTGQYQAAADNGGYIYTSPDYGVTWSQQGVSIGSTLWGDISISGNGQYLVVGVSAGGYLYVSSDYGANWTSKFTDSNRNWYATGISNNGQYQTACVYNGGIYTSSNYGSTWALNGSAPSANWTNGLGISSTGQYQVAAVYPGYAYLSSNYGATWAQSTNSGSRNWNAVTMSQTGVYLSGCVSSGFIYTSETPAITLSPAFSLFNALSDVSLNRRLYLGSDASVNGNISTRNIAVSGIVFQF